MGNLRSIHLVICYFQNNSTELTNIKRWCEFSTDFPPTKIVRCPISDSCHMKKLWLVEEKLVCSTSNFLNFYQRCSNTRCTLTSNNFVDSFCVFLILWQSLNWKPMLRGMLKLCWRFLFVFYLVTESELKLMKVKVLTGKSAEKRHIKSSSF